jgi:hypothetical protein
MSSQGLHLVDLGLLPGDDPLREVAGGTARPRLDLSLSPIR